MLLLYSFCLCANYKCPDVLFYFKNCLKTSKFCSSFDLIGINLFHTYHITKLLIIDNNFQINAIWTWKIILSISFNLSYLNIPRDASLRYVLSPDLEDWWNSFLLLLKPRSCNNVFISSVCNFFSDCFCHNLNRFTFCNANHLEVRSKLWLYSDFWRFPLL